MQQKIVFYSMSIVNELGSEVRLKVALEAVEGGTIFDESVNWIPLDWMIKTSQNYWYHRV